VLDEFAERVAGSGDTGSLDGPSFLAALLEWVLGAYTAAFERIEQRLEDFDVHAMRGEGADKDIELLVDMRREVGSLRRALAAPAVHLDDGREALELEQPRQRRVPGHLPVQLQAAELLRARLQGLVGMGGGGLGSRSPPPIFAVLLRGYRPVRR
jgi:hypothetical protein